MTKIYLPIRIGTPRALITGEHSDTPRQCDESKPTCGNCHNHSITCDYGANPSRSFGQSAETPSPAASLQHSTSDDTATLRQDSEAYSSPLYPNVAFVSPQSASSYPSNEALPEATPSNNAALPCLNVIDLELLHNFTISTCYTFSKDTSLQTFFRINVPQIGFSNPVVLQSLLAISAVHLARFRHEARSRYLALGHAHYQSALRLGTAQFAALNASNAHALFLFINLCSGFALSVGPQPGDYLLFGTSGPAEWLVLFRGVRTILESHGVTLMRGPLTPIFRSVTQILCADQPLPEFEPLRALRSQIVDALEPNDPNLETYDHAIDSLARSWPTRALGSTLQTMGAWLYCVPDTFVDRLQERKPAAMVIFAYFLVLMNELEASWWAKGWVDHIMRGIYEILDEEWRIRIRWPMERIGWIPG
jgi:Fungal specific transcription factor domain